MAGDSATRPIVIVWIVIHVFVRILTVTLATDKHIYEDDPKSQDGTTCADIEYNVNVKHTTECDYYHAGSVNVLNCSNIQQHNLNVLDHVNDNIDIIHVYDVSNASLTEMITLSYYKLFGQLKILNASHNQIKELHETSFKGLIYIEKINLSHNKLMQLPDNVFADMMELKFLDISNNILITLPAAMPMLDWFDASSNHITTLPETFSSILYPQRVVLIGKNPFRCDCKITWLKEWFNTRMYLLKYVTHIDIEKFIPSCFYPENLSAKGWDVLEDGDFKCTESDDRKSSEASINVRTANHNSEIEIRAWVEEVSIHSVLVKWTEITKHPTSSIEIRFHTFGKSKDVRKIVIPLTAGSFRLKNLDEGTPYIICFSILPEARITLDCEEIVTSKALQKSSSSEFLVEKVFFFISENIVHIVLLFIIVFVTLCALSHVLFENDKNKVKNDL